MVPDYYRKEVSGACALGCSRRCGVDTTAAASVSESLEAYSTMNAPIRRTSIQKLRRRTYLTKGHTLTWCHATSLPELAKEDAAAVEFSTIP
jgi:hypothetical protein